MLINVAQMIVGPIGSIKNLDVDVELAVDEGVRSATIKGALSLMRTDGGILVQGNLAAVIGCTCVRCLIIFDYGFELEMEEEYVPVREASARTGRIVLETEGLLIDSQNLLDLEPALREYAVLNAPLKPLCNPACAGLCIQCGADLNRARCMCSPPLNGSSKDNQDQSPFVVARGQTA
jgi:uncharacterized protein